MARRRLRDRLRRQVRDEGALRFDPQVREIRSTAREVRQQTRGDVRAARLTGRDAVRSARAARPAAARSLSDALRAVATTPSPEVAASSLGAAAGRDAQGAQRRLAETKAGLDAELIAREQDARAGTIASVRDARGRQAQELGKLRQQLRGIAADRGVFSSGRLGELLGDAADRRVTRRGQDVTERNSKRSADAAERRSIRSSGIDPDTGKVIKGGKLDPDGNGRRGDQGKGGKGKGGKNRATDTQILDAQTAVDLAKRQAKRLKGEEGLSRGEAAALLIEGRDALVDPKTNKKISGTKVKSVKQLFASVALDLAYDGRVSERNRSRLRARGYSLRDFGIKPLKVKPQARRPVGTNNKAPF